MRVSWHGCGGAWKEGAGEGIEGVCVRVCVCVGEGEGEGGSSKC